MKTLPYYLGGNLGNYKISLMVSKEVPIYKNTFLGPKTTTQLSN